MLSNSFLKGWVYKKETNQLKKTTKQWMVDLFFILLQGTLVCFSTPFHSYDYNTNSLHTKQSFFFFLSTKHKQKRCFGCARLDSLWTRWEPLGWGILTFQVWLSCPARVALKSPKWTSVMMFCTFVKGVKQAKLNSSPKNRHSTETKKKKFIMYELISASLLVAYIPEKFLFHF